MTDQPTIARKAPTAQQFADACEALIGTPFKHRGRNHAGIDCRGLFLVGLEDVGAPVEPFDDYQPQPDPAVLLREVRARFDEVAWHERLLPGRILVLRQRNGGDPKHFAVTLGLGMAMHRDTLKAKRFRVHDEFVHSVWRARGIDYQEGG